MEEVAYEVVSRDDGLPVQVGHESSRRERDHHMARLLGRQLEEGDVRILVSAQPDREDKLGAQLRQPEVLSSLAAREGDHPGRRTSPFAADSRQGSFRGQRDLQGDVVPPLERTAQRVRLLPGLGVERATVQDHDAVAVEPPGARGGQGRSPLRLQIGILDQVRRKPRLPEEGESLPAAGPERRVDVDETVRE